ncbi:MAG: 30S ribosomal protein S3 [Burkholderiales bacterium]
MGQKIHPTGFRLAVNHAWTSRWFANSKSFAAMLNEDLKVREYLRGKLRHASVGRVIIERPAKDARITIHSSRPGVVIGKKGEDIEIIKAELRKMLGVQAVHVNIEEIRKPETDAQLIADSITQQLEKRIMFRRAMKRAMQNAMRLGAQGIKIMSAGRLNGIEIARTEWYREGRVPLHTLRADIDYGFSEAKTTYGIIGCKVWVYKGDVLGRNEQPSPFNTAPAVEEDPNARRPSRRPPRADGDTRGAPAPAPGAPSGDRPRPPAGRTRVKRAVGDAKADSVAKPDADKTKPATPVVKRVVKKGDGDASAS